MAQTKLSRKELREDEFINVFGRVFRYVSLHSRSFMVAGIVLVLLILAISFARFFFERYEAKASRGLYLADEAYGENLALISEDSPWERKGVPDFEKPLKLYQEVLKAYPRSDSAGVALYQSAQCFYHLSRYDEAISAFQKYIRRHPRGKLSVLAGLGLGYSFEHKSEFDKAVAAYSAAITNSPNDPLIGEVFVSLARCQEATGKREEANKTYTQVVEKFPNSSWKFYAERRLLYLKGR